MSKRMETVLACLAIALGITAFDLYVYNLTGLECVLLGFVIATLLF